MACVIYDLINDLRDLKADLYELIKDLYDLKTDLYEQISDLYDLNKGSLQFNHRSL